MELKPIILFIPTLDDGKSVLQALNQRKTILEISNKKLSGQLLSNLLWAACGVNGRKDRLESRENCSDGEQFSGN